VGFVRNLPHSLVEAFKATLEEAVLADFLIHVVDGSNERAIEFYETTMEVLVELGAGEKKQILLFNKSDKIEDEVHRQALANRFPEAIFVSAYSGEGLEELSHTMSEVLSDRVRRMEVRLPLDRMDLAALLHREAKVLAEEYDEEGVEIAALIPKTHWHLFEEYLVSTNDF